jgi:ribosomal-protein-alanine N-acetyltransferase
MVLRPLRESDRAEYIRILALSRQHLSRHSCLHREGESDAALFARHLEVCRVGDERGTAWRRVGVLDEGRIAGCFNLNSIARGLTFEADANWWLSADAVGLGLGYEGVAAMLDYALADLPSGLGLHKVHAAIMPSNMASIRLAERVGLSRQSTGKVSIKIGERWEFHEVYSRSVLDQPVSLSGIAC